jgi:hypothetical protein
MYSFTELHPHQGKGFPDSFAYWLCCLHKEPKDFSAGNLKSAMSYHFDVEEQAYTPKMLNSRPELIPKCLTPIAPVTLAPQWSPFPMAVSILGKPEQHGSDSGSAFAVWTPRYLGGDEVATKTTDEAHFLFLIRLATSAARASKCRVLLVGSPGWCYRTAAKRYMNPDTAVMMHDAGYLFTERVPR